MGKQKKTNAMRILDSAKVVYSIYEYDTKDGFLDGVSVANKIGKETSKVYKTLVTQGASKDYHVFIIPVEDELNLKAAAKAVGEKKVEMIPVKDITKITGYIKGGCSPVGMKKLFSTTIDSSCESLDNIIVSAGRVGTQMELSITDLIDIIRAQTAEVTK